MGSVSMQSQASSRGERLSAFVDGESVRRRASGNLDKFLSELDGRGSRRVVELSPDRRRVAFRRSGGQSRNEQRVHERFRRALRSEPHLLAPAAMPRLRGASAGAAPPRRAGVRGGRRGCHADVDRRAATAGRDSRRSGRADARAVAPADSVQRVAMASVPAATAQSGRAETRTSSATRVSTSISKLISSSRNNRSCRARCR